MQNQWPPVYVIATGKKLFSFTSLYFLLSIVVEPATLLLSVPKQKSWRVHDSVGQELEQDSAGWLFCSTWHLLRPSYGIQLVDSGKSRGSKLPSPRFLFLSHGWLKGWVNWVTFFLHVASEPLHVGHWASSTHPKAPRDQGGSCMSR